MARLNTLRIRSLQPGRHGDGGGLWLQVRNAEHRSWLFRFMLHGRAREMGLGPVADITLAEAREAARNCRRLLRDGVDPIENRRVARAAAREAAQVVCFREAVERYLRAHESTWRNEKHRYQWRATLELANAVFGDRAVPTIGTGDVMRVLEPIWHEKPETASRLRGRIEAVLDYATAHGWRTGENPARWRGHLAKLLPLPSRIAKVKHYAALPWDEIGSFTGELRDQEGVAALALQFTILTAARTGEVIGARWDEIDLDNAMWTVPGERMKAGQEHRVPLSPPAMAILQTLLPLRDRRREGSGYVFAGGKPGRPLSNMAMMMLLRRMGRGDLTVHGFRSTFRDWTAEATSCPREVAEQALAHTLVDRVEAAYRRGDLFEKRRLLMGEWAEFCAVKSSRTSSYPVTIQVA